MTEKSDSGVHRLPLLWGWAIGFRPTWCFGICRYYPGWSIAILWFHFGRKVDRDNWSHSAEDHMD